MIGIVAAVLVALIAALHSYVLYLEMFACVVVAGLYGGATASRRILVVQALPGALALVATLAR